MYKLRIKHYIIIIALQILMICTIVLGKKAGSSGGSVGYLHIEPGNNSLYIEDYDLTIKGQDKEYTTYFVMPSYVSVVTLSQDRSENKIYTESGEILTDPDYCRKQHVLVDSNDGNPVEWDVEFLKSGDVYTIDIDLNGAEADDIEKENYTEASMEVITPDGRVTYLDDILIKGRGNSTWLHSKKPYDLKLPKLNSLMGLTASTKWSLLANAKDDTNVINKLTMDLAQDLGLKYTSDSEWCDLYINNEYRGNYLLCKEPGIGFGRVDIDGCLFECDDREGSDKPSFFIGQSMYKIKDISRDDPAAGKEIEAFVTKTDAELHSSPINKTHIDIDSFVKRYLIEEYVYNVDSMGLSYFFYKENDKDVLFAGPCWDYDKSCGKSGFGQEKYLNYDLALEKPEGAGCDWDFELMDDEDYRERMLQIYSQNRYLFQRVISDRIDEYENRVYSASIPDSIVWGNDHEKHLMYSDFDNKFRYLKFFLSKRLLLLDSITGYKTDEAGFDVSTSDTHEIVFYLEDGSSKTITVKDGTQIKPEKLPPYNEEYYNGWRYKREEGLFSYYLPVFEDIELELNEIEE